MCLRRFEPRGMGMTRTVMMMACLMLAGGALAEIVEVSPVVISELYHGYYYNTYDNRTSIYDAVTFPDGPGTFSGPGFSAAIGQNDEVVIRYEAPENYKFSVELQPGATTRFHANANWTTGVGDAASHFETASVTWEGLSGPAPTLTYELYAVSNNGEAVLSEIQATLTGDFEFTALELRFTVSHAVADLMRTYGSVGSSSAPSFSASIYELGNLADRTIMSLVRINPILITSVSDVGNDQGGQVRIAWSAAAADPVSAEDYLIYRRVDAYKAVPPGDWDYVASVPAAGLTAYSAVVPTLCDSTISHGLCESVFFIRLTTDNALTFYDSPPDSGYSLDNLAPAVPTGLGLDADLLSWDDPVDADFDYFTVYESATPDLSGASRLGWTTGTSLALEGVEQSYLLVTATDFSGNEGLAAAIDSYAGVETTPRAFRLLGAAPNPFNPKTTIRYELPEDREVDLRIFDATGRLVRVLRGGQVVPAGHHSLEWNGRDDSGRAVAAGVYIYRLSAGDDSDHGRMVLVK